MRRNRARFKVRTKIEKRGGDLRERRWSGHMSIIDRIRDSEDALLTSGTTRAQVRAKLTEWKRSIFEKLL